MRLGMALILLPVMLRVLPKEDLGMYYIFLRLIALVPILDFGFSVTVGRCVSYATAGATELKSQGVLPETEIRPPNMGLLWKLLFACRQLYLYLAAITLVILGGFGTYNVALNVNETSVPVLTWVAWILTLAGAILEIYFGWWTVFLRGTNQVLSSARYAAMGALVQLCLAVALLLGGAGLLSFPVASIVGNTLQRYLSRKCCLLFLQESNAPSNADIRPVFSILWPNSWRAGLQFLSVYIGTSVPALIVAKRIGTSAFSGYGISAQIMSICAIVASVWTLVKWPTVGQLNTTRAHEQVRRILRPRLWLQFSTYFVLSIIVVAWGSELLEIIGSRKELLSQYWLLLLCVTVFLDMQFSFWTTLLSLENRIPSLWPTVATNIVSLGLFFFMLRTVEPVAALVWPPLLAGCLFNYWYWLFEGARSLRTTWFAFMFFGEKSAARNP